MKNQLDYSEFVERYIDGEMGESELIWFRKELDANPELQREVRLRKRVNNSISLDKYMQYRDELEEAYYAYEAGKEKIWGRKAFRVVLGSVLTMALIGAVILVNPLSRNNSEKLFNKYYKPYEVTMTLRSANSMLDADLHDAMQRYKGGDYKGALVLFEKIISSDPTRIGLNFYSGISHMETKEYEQAGNSFNKVVADKYNMYYEQAEWYLALCYLITNQNDKATDLFKKIVGQKGYYSKSAAKIVRKLR